MSQSLKYTNFVSEPISNKSVNEIPGIGVLTAEKLIMSGFTKAYHVLGQFLLLNLDEELFINWLKSMGSLNYKTTYNALHDWTHAFI